MPERHAARLRRDAPVDTARAAELRGVTFAYDGGPAVLRDVNLAVPPGRIVMLLGQSGSGKTTLLKLARGLLRPTRGEVLVLGEPVRAKAQRGRLDPRVAYIPQQLGLVRSQTAVENAALGSLARAGIGSLIGLPGAELRRARETLEALGIGHRADAPARSLSGGERQRVAIARSLMQGAQVVLADELVSQLDPVTTEETMAIVARIVAQGVTVLMTTHELGVVTRYAHGTVVLSRGRVVLEQHGAKASADQLAAALAS